MRVSKMAMVSTAVTIILAAAAVLAAHRDVTVHHQAPAGAAERDLGRLVGAQESYAAAHNGVYFSGILSDPTDSVGSFTPSPGVRIVVLAEGAGWSATAAGSDDETHVCAVAVKTRPGLPARSPGVVGCN